MNKSVSNIISAIVISIIVSTCANRGTISGGEKDEEPPIITKESPENFSIDFKENEIRIYFNEYVKIKDVQKQLIISPPMKTQPEITPLGGASKYISIKIYDTLLPNTTYAFNFGQSIVDNNEENPYSYYRYVFSTGATIDSLSVKGVVLDAENRSPDTFISVMLYEIDSTYNDSLVYKQKPKYVTNTLDSLTTFSIDNIKEGTYKLIALKEESANFTFQPKSDKIGFQEGFITVPKDTLYSIKLFKEELPFKVIRPAQIGEQRIIFPFEGDAEDVSIKVLGDTPNGYKSRITKDKETDSLYYWYNPKFEADSTQFIVKNKTVIDTLKFKFRKADKDSLRINVVKSGALNFDETFGIEANIPFTKIDKSKIKLIDKDSIDVAYTVVYDSLYNRYSFPIKLKEDDSYKMELLPDALTDMYENTNDTLNYTFRTRKKSDFGNLRVNLVNAKFPLIVQLVDDAGKVLYERYTTESTKIDFNDINPKNYFIRAIFDANSNQKYDSGNFLENRQAERVSYYPTVIEVRANFDFIETFTLLD